VLSLRLDADLRITAANALARRVLPEGAIGRPLAESVMDFGATVDVPALVVRDGNVHLLTLKTAAGLPESFYFRFFAVDDGVGEEGGSATLALGGLDFAEQLRLRGEVLTLNRDLNNLTRQLHVANGELRDLNELKNQFLGMAAHDLRKPVGVIMTYGEFVLEEAGAALTGEQRGFLRTCIDAAAGMKLLIDDFLDVSVIESGRLRLDRAPATVAGILATAGEFGAVLARKKKITLVLEPPEPGLHLQADAPKLQQVLLNLIGNAVEHSVAGQRVWLSVQRDANELVFAVRDEGAGIAPADQQRLFAPFERAGTKKTAGERSTGLGLAISRKIVEAHGGRIWVESTPGQGANFRFALPAGDDKETVKDVKR